jgi:hypothetical protein
VGSSRKHPNGSGAWLITGGFVVFTVEVVMERSALVEPQASPVNTTKTISILVRAQLISITCRCQ